MKRSTLLASLSFVLLLSACHKDPVAPRSGTSASVLAERTTTSATPTGDPLTRAELDRQVIDMLEARNDFHWEWVDLRTLWSAVQYNDHSLAIGYAPTDYGDIDDIIHTIDIQRPEWRAVHDALIERILEQLNVGGRGQVTLRDILLEDDPVLPILTLRITDKDVITMLRNLKNVRYVEPLDYWPGTAEERSTSGCDGSSEPLNGADFNATTPNALVPWNFNIHGIPTAWNNAQGNGITIGLIDGGISSAQSLLGSDFNNGDSNVGRTVTTGYTYGGAAYTTCTHGNSMAGLAVGPRNNMGASSGVAYRSGLHFIRACEDVVLDEGGELTGVKNALVALGNNPAVRVISMSVGTPFSSGKLRDGVNYAHGNGKLLMAAAGTSFSWTSWWGVIYPAVLNKCTAITGVNESDGTCESCHDGSEVDFTIMMERDANTARNSLSLPASGTTPTYIGGSSAATATAAGIAALVWSVNPNKGRGAVLNCLKNTAQFPTGNGGDHGYGKLNADAAVNCALAW
ncbi:MAG: S8 family serine peptidase [Flavobacteriales bacterium]